MASKFFSRSKAESKTSWPGTPPMGGLVAIDTECEWPDTSCSATSPAVAAAGAGAGAAFHSGHAAMSGFGYSHTYGYANDHFRKSAAPHNRPKPLDLSVSTHNIYTASDLHDAALHSVSSASNLLAVVNGMLKSPLLATHHKPLPPRPQHPRSKTAPSTPEHLVPELPGSILLKNRGFPQEPRSASATDDERRRRRLTYQASSATVRTAPPRTTPMDSFFPPMPELRKSRLTRGLSAINTAMDSRITLCSQPTNPNSSFESTNDGNDSESSSSLRPSPLNVEKNGCSSSGNSLRPAALGSRSRSYGGPSHVTRTSLSSIHSDGQQIEQLKLTLDAQKHTISTLTDQFSSLKGSHEAHVSSLVESHAKEMNSLRTYIEGLEQRQSRSKPLNHDQPQDAQNLQTFREIRPDSPNSVPSVPPRAPTRSSKEEDRVRREHSRLKKKIETANSQTIAIMTQLENARKQESAFRNEVQALEARLEEANMEKVDALEAAFTYEGEIKRLQQKHKTLFQDKELRVEAVHAQSQDFARKLESAESEINKLTAQLKTANERRPEEDAISAFVRQIEDLQSKLTTSKSDRHRLKKENEHFRLELDDAEQRLKEVMKVNEKLVREGTQGGEYGRVRRENLELKAKCSKYEESIAKIQLNSEEYYRLLKSEIKRKACKRQQCLEDGHLDPLLYPLANTDLSPRDKERLLSKEMKETKSKAARLLGLSEDSQDPQTQLRILEKENDYHVRDIVAYRVVVRDYEREAKKLAARIQKRDTMLLQLQQHKQTHPSPSRDTPQSSVSSASTGPGYSPRTPQFPPGTPSTAMSTPLSSISMGRTERAASAPQGSGQVPKLGSRSSFSIHKKLPKPPPLTSPSEDSPKNPRGLGITSHPYSGPPPSPSPRSVPRIGNSPMQSLTPIREVSLKMRKSRRTMSESVVTAYPRTPPNGTGRESDASPEKTERSSSNESVPRPSLPELAGNSAIPASQDATITSPDTTSAAHDTEREREMWKSRKAAVRANVLARAEGRTDASERSDGSPMGRVLRLKRSKKDLGGSVEEGKRSPGFWRGDGIKGHSRTRSEA